MQIAAGKFKANCLKIMDNVKNYHQEIVITKHGKPVAKLVPIDGEKPETVFGIMKDRINLMGDIIEPIDEKWSADEQ